MFSAEQLSAAQEVLDACRTAGLKLAVAESCTGGLIAACLTAVAGSSDVVERGFVTYTNEAKHDMLGVDTALIKTAGAVSEDVARAMAEGALALSSAQIAVAVTGIAGPDGGTADKPVGLVHIAAVRDGGDGGGDDGGETLHQRHQFEGDRAAVRAQSVTAALEMVRKLAG